MSEPEMQGRFIVPPTRAGGSSGLRDGGAGSEPATSAAHGRNRLEPQEQSDAEPFADGPEPQKQPVFVAQRDAESEPQAWGASGSRLRSVPDAEAERLIPAPVQSPWVRIAVVAALLLGLGALGWSFLLQQQFADTERKLALAQEGSSAFSRRLAEADARMRANSADVSQQLTAAERRQQELAARAAALASQQKSDTTRLEASEATTTKQLGAVQGDVSTVRTEVASTKTAVAATRTDLADTKQILQRTIGDAGVMSGLIAKNHDELEVLKHKGDRSYYEFTLHKGAQPTLLATVKLQLKKLNDKKGRYTMVVSSDDRNIEKKDKTVLEPVQFYSGKDPALFEVVVNSMGKDVVGGYLSVPKGQ